MRPEGSSMNDSFLQYLPAMLYSAYHGQSNDKREKIEKVS
jgi:hypothetical protein